MREAKGFDASGESDALDREAFARRIYDCLVSVQAEWSVRVALYGTWGLGKTTVADWITRWSKTDGHIPISLSVGAENSDTIWHALVEAIDRGLTEANVRPDRSRLEKALHFTKKQSKSISQAASLTPSVSGGGVTVGGAVLSGVSNLLRFTEADVAHIRKGLGDKRRIIVLIDDLDRIDGTVLPRVLLAVRDLLDVPGFSFLLPLDDAVVVKVIERHTGIAGSGEGFLEKIADFHFRLPQLDRHQTVRFLEELLADSAPFIPTALVAELAEILPKTPRRLKSIARHLAILRGIIDRYGPGGINWKRVLFALILRQEHAKFAECFFQDYLARYNPYSDLAVYGTAIESSKDEQLVLTFDTLRTRVQLTLEEVDSIKPIFDFFWRDRELRRSGQQLVESVQLLDAPPALTASELSQVTNFLFSEALDRNALHSELSKLKRDIAVGFGLMVGAMRHRYQQELSLVLNAFSTSESAIRLSKAEETLQAMKRLVEIDLSEIDGSHFELFEALYEVAKVFRANAPLKASVFDVEDLVLTSIIDKAPAPDLISIDLLIHNDDLDQEDGKELTALSRKVMKSLARRESDIILDRFKVSGFADYLAAFPERSVIKRVFADPDGPLWNATESRAWQASLEGAPNEPIIQRNAFDCLTKLSKMLCECISISGRGTHFVRDATALLRLSTAATATPFAPIYQYAYSQTRSEILKNGGVADSMPLPGWFAIDA